MRHVLSLSALLVASFILVFGNGLASLLIPARASQEGWSTDTIALIGASYSLAFTAGCLIVPRMVARVGHIRVFGALGTIIVVSMLLHALEPTSWFWIAVRGLAGFSVAGSYMILESWLNEETSNENRGLVFSIYMVISLAGQALGPFIVTLGDPRGFELFAWAAIVYAVSTLPIALTGRMSPQPLTKVSLDLRNLYRNSPAAFVGSFVTGMVAGSFASLLPVYGLGIGLTTAAIATLIAAANLGSVVFQVPIGRASDKVDRRIVMVAVGVAGALLAVAMMLVPTPVPAVLPARAASVEASDVPVLFGVMFLFGGTLYTTYSLNVAHANDWARGVSFVTVASGLLVLYGVGATVGPLVAARVMAVVGPPGLFAFMIGCNVLYAGFALWRITQRGNVPIDDQVDFKALPVTRVATPQTFELDSRSDDEGAEGWDIVTPDYEVAGEA